jgi:homoserine O-acetyltransferase
MNTYNHEGIFRTELGDEIEGLEIAYHTYGKINDARDNIIWVCHALTANSDVVSWWPGFVGEGHFYDPEKYFIVCANFLGSCYGTTGPMSVNPRTGKPWLNDFPHITVRDLVQAHELLRIHLGIEKIHTVIGGSIGGLQSLEWAILNPDLFENVILIACSERTSPWVIAFNESQRLALMADPTFLSGKGGVEGLKAARSIALLTYRSAEAYNRTQAEHDNEKTTNFRASSYQKYQGEKLVARFNAYSYYIITRIVDSHNVGRGRNGNEEALKRIKANTLVIGISTDILFPVEEQIRMASIIPHAKYQEIHSDFGHDGLLLEYEQLADAINNFYNNTPAQAGDDSTYQLSEEISRN